MPSHDGALFLGVDGGGTKTCFVLMDRRGAEVARHVAPSGYYLQIGLDALAARLDDGVAAVLAAAGANRDDVAHAFFGLPSHGEDSRITPALDALPGAILGHDRYQCGNDMICGWAGSLGGADGISITAGTGSIGYGERRGVAARAGGWGELFSDEGSAHWVARRMLNLFTRMSDGRMPRGPLHGLLRAHFGLGDDLDLCGHVLSDERATRDRIAALSTLASEAAAQGDAAVLALFAQAADELVAIAEAIRLRLGFGAGETVAISYSGGVFSSGAFFLAMFRDGLARACPDYRLQTPLHDPGLGAAIYARRLADARNNQEAARTVVQEIR
ncbi:N-acetylglucosamine kinase [Sphingomonas sp. LM7]|uniref:N-acetylglucosamine kinase n=1 Tax=Sphingomonas sp. LM7 TaxID=1938607 RepID=UPI000983DF97|nr:BadF/BadG/BcrA/BcrD ATPase family protein [Sphingomonas sp. LM7]AQR75057.1 N-acetylglucosamine kinase [Sphingomonas sp. LM7]